MTMMIGGREAWKGTRDLPQPYAEPYVVVCFPWLRGKISPRTPGKVAVGKSRRGIRRRPNGARFCPLCSRC